MGKCAVRSFMKQTPALPESLQSDTRTSLLYQYHKYAALGVRFVRPKKIKKCFVSGHPIDPAEIPPTL